MTSLHWFTEEEALALHDLLLAHYGGASGVRDAGLLSSALARPRQLSHYGTPDLVEIAAAYLFFLCRNHPFLDGNKPAALGACLVFLRLNGKTPQPDGPEWEELVLAVAGGQLDREQTAHRLRALVREAL